MQFDPPFFDGEEEGEDSNAFLFEITDEDYLRELQTLTTASLFPNDYEQDNEYESPFHFHSERLDEAEEIEELAFLPHQDRATDEFSIPDDMNQLEMINPFFEREQLDLMGDSGELKDDKVKEGVLEEEEEEEAELDYSSLSIGDYTEEEKRRLIMLQYFTIYYAFSFTFRNG